MLKRILLGMCVTLMLPVMHARADTLDDIKKAGVLKVAVLQDAPPYSSVNRDMVLEGLEIDVANLLAKKMGVKLELVRLSGANRIAYLQTHKADLLVSTLGKNEERAKLIDFSQPYAPFNNSVLGAKDISVKNVNDLANQTIGVTRGTFQDLLLTPAVPASTTIKRYEDNAGLVAAYVSGQVKLIATSAFTQQAIDAKNPPNKLELKYVIQESACRVGLNKDEPALLARVNAIISEAKDNGQLSAIVQKWLNTPMSETMLQTRD